jgi:(S)-2-hydroxyglutarate dehydrogenase
MWRDYVKWAFVRELQRYVPKVRSRNLSFGPSGVRAQCMSADGKLVEDFLLEEADGVLHVLNAPDNSANGIRAAHTAGVRGHRDPEPPLPAAC